MFSQHWLYGCSKKLKFQNIFCLFIIKWSVRMLMYLCQTPMTFLLGCQRCSSHEKEQNKNRFQLLEFFFFRPESIWCTSNNFLRELIPLLYNRSHVICLSGSEFRRHMSLTGVPYWHGCLFGRKGILARWEMLIRHIIPAGAVANDATMSSLPCTSHLFLPGVIRICWQRSRWAVHQYVWQTKIYS